MCVATLPRWRSPAATLATGVVAIGAPERQTALRRAAVVALSAAVARSLSASCRLGASALITIEQSGWCRRVELGDELLDSAGDLVPGGSDLVDRPTLGVLEVPVEVA